MHNLESVVTKSDAWATPGTSSAVAQALRSSFVAHLPARETQHLLGKIISEEWATFASSWDDLDLDGFMNDGGRYRRRRHAVFSATGTHLARLEHRPHFQPVRFNQLNGGISRTFAPVTSVIAEHPLTAKIISTFVPIFEAAASEAPAGPWEVEMHQFRIEAIHGSEGRPTPEGVHRDGVDWVVMLLVGRTNVQGGVTSVEDLHGRPLREVLLDSPLDTVVLDDRKLRHGATPISPLNDEAPALRDMLVLTFRKKIAGT